MYRSSKNAEKPIAIKRLPLSEHLVTVGSEKLPLSRDRPPAEPGSGRGSYLPLPAGADGGNLGNQAKDIHITVSHSCVHTQNKKYLGLKRI